VNGVGRKLDDYRAVAPRGSVDFMLRIAERLRGRRIVQVSASRYGGAGAEILNRMVPILNDLGIETSWEVMLGSVDFDAIVTAVSKGLAGVEQVVTEAMLARLHATCAGNAKRLPLDADLVLVHDAASLLLVEGRPPAGRWLWRYHGDLSTPQPQLWNALRPFVDKYDAAVFSASKFAAPLSTRRFVIAPSIDPLSERNREMPRSEQSRHLERLGVRTDKPILLQVGAFDRLQDPLGVVNAYRLVKKHYDLRLVLAGAAGADPESPTVLAELREAAQRDPDVLVRELPPDAHLQINALQRAATIVLQKSVRESFGLGAAEAMWKGKPVIGGFVGGLPHQIVYDVTGYTVHSVEGAAFRLRHLLNNRELIARMGAAGREHVRRSFLITRHLVDYMALLIHVVP
jgi:trehalose synthase